MVQRGRRNVKNEFTGKARQQPDPCAYLRKLKDDPNTSTENRLKITTAEKSLGCQEVEKRAENRKTKRKKRRKEKKNNNPEDKY